jgi:hypothetical protein
MEDLGKELSNQKAIQEQCEKTYQKVKQSFKDQQDRVNDQIDFWDIYNCKLNHNQSYESSISRIYVPIVHSAVEARVTRFTNQIFPQNGRYVEMVTHDGTYPYAHMALLENYVRLAKLRTEIMPALVRNGDVEGQYTIYVGWKKSSRKVRVVDTESIRVEEEGDEDDDYFEVEGAGEVVTIKEEELKYGRPHVDVISDADLAIYPATADSVEDALDMGGSVTILMRLTSGKIDEMVADGTFDKKKAEQLKEGFGNNSAESGVYGSRSIPEEQGYAAGVQVEGNTKVAHVYQTWTKLKVNGEMRLCVIYYGGDDLVLSCKRNPYWCDKCPVISVPIRKLSGVCKGVSMVKPVAELQYMANDAANLAMSSGIYSLQPIVMTDPEKNPRIGTMLMNVGAIWQTNPNDTQLVEFPPIYQKGFEIIDWCKAEIFQSLSVNPAMITQGSAYRRPTQAEVANEQMVDVVSTADAVTTIEEGILTPMLERFYEYDKQFRKEGVTVRAYGEMGLRAKMEVIEPIQVNHRYSFRWFGVEQSRSAQRIQQQISAINVIRGIPPQLTPGRELDLVPFVESLAENAFGSRLAPMVFKDIRSQLMVDPILENEMFMQGYDMEVNSQDDDVAHLEAHMAELPNDQTGYLKVHIEAHRQQLMAKQQQAMMGAAQANPTSAPAGGANMPMAGSSPAGPSNMKQPAGAIHPDQMQDPSMMPRNM